MDKGKEGRWISAEQASKLIDNRTTLGLLTVGPGYYPTDICKALERRFLGEGRPRDVTVLFNLAYGEDKGDGIDRFAHKGMTRRVIGADYSFAPKINRMITKNLVEAYSFPSTVVSDMIRGAAQGKAGVITPLGLKSFVDPHQAGGRLNLYSQDDLVETIVFQGEEQLFYQTIPLDVAILKGERSDEMGNVYFHSPQANIEATALAIAAKKNHGFVVVEVDQVGQGESCWSLPGYLVDHIVVRKRESGRKKVGITGFGSDLAQEWKIITGRVVREIQQGQQVGIERRLRRMYPSLLLDSKPFHLVADWLREDQNSWGNRQEAYGPGMIDLSLLPFNQIDGDGNINMSKYGHKLRGCGRLLELCHNSRKLIFCGPFTTHSLSTSVRDGQLVVIKEGRSSRFVPEVDHLTFCSEVAIGRGIEVLYVTERAVFTLGQDGLVLTEIAPGIDLWKDLLHKLEFEVTISPQLQMMEQHLFVGDEEISGDAAIR